jgi:hypothetical protein
VPDQRGQAGKQQHGQRRAARQRQAATRLSGTAWPFSRR